MNPELTDLTAEGSRTVDVPVTINRTGGGFAAGALLNSKFALAAALSLILHAACLAAFFLCTTRECLSGDAGSLVIDTHAAEPACEVALFLCDQGSKPAPTAPEPHAVSPAILQTVPTATLR